MYVYEGQSFMYRKTPLHLLRRHPARFRYVHTADVTIPEGTVDCSIALIRKGCTKRVQVAVHRLIGYQAVKKKWWKAMLEATMRKVRGMCALPRGDDLEKIKSIM